MTTPGWADQTGHRIASRQFLTENSGVSDIAADAFFEAAAPASQTITGTLFTDSDSFGAGVLAPTIALAGTLLADGDSFGAGTITQSGGTQTITGVLYANDNTFGAGTVVGGSQATQEYGHGPFTFPKKAKTREDDAEEADPPPDVVRLGPAPREKVQTGIVELPKRPRQPAKTDTIDRLEAARMKAEAANRDRIRRIIAQDDEWLMMA